MTAERKPTPSSRAADAPVVLQPRAGAAPRSFERTDAWIFDLDNTLYPAECNLFAEVDRRMGEFIARYLGVPFAHARHLQKSYYRQFGTTLSGLMKVHKLDPSEFLAYVHDIDLSAISPCPALRAEIAALPGRRLIYTNGSHHHAERVAEKLGVLDLFEDMPMNLAVPHDLGMTTVLVHSSYLDHPVQQQMKSWTELPDHIHHMTLDLTAFLEMRRDAAHKSSEHEEGEAPDA